jgi:hypothetical protein
MGAVVPNRRMSIYGQLIGAVRIVEAWPEPKQAKEYWLDLTPSQYAEAWTFIWGHFGVRSLPKLVSAPSAAR